MHHKKGERSYVEYHMGQATFYYSAATQDAWLADAIGKLVQNVKIFLLQMARSKS